MAVSRYERRLVRQSRVSAVFAEGSEAALDLLELVDLAWHDCYDDITPPDDVVDDMLLLSDGSLAGLIRAAHLAVSDWRDLRVAAEEHRPSA